VRSVPDPTQAIVSYKVVDNRAKFDHSGLVAPTFTPLVTT